MTQIVKKSSIAKYRDVSKQLNQPKHKLKSKKRDKIYYRILKYNGIENIEVPGSFLNTIQDVTALPVPEIAKALNISKSTYYRRASDTNMLDMTYVDRISSLLKIYEKGYDSFEGNKEEFHDWLNTKIPTLSYKKPIELLKTESGRIAVLETIGRIKYNVYG